MTASSTLLQPLSTLRPIPDWIARLRRGGVVLVLVEDGLW